jgi:hypothetical protein
MFIQCDDCIEQRFPQHFQTLQDTHKAPLATLDENITALACPPRRPSKGKNGPPGRPTRCPHLPFTELRDRGRGDRGRVWAWDRVWPEDARGPGWSVVGGWRGFPALHRGLQGIQDAC